MGREYRLMAACLVAGGFVRRGARMGARASRTRISVLSTPRWRSSRATTRRSRGDLRCPPTRAAPPRPGRALGRVAPHARRCRRAACGQGRRRSPAGRGSHLVAVVARALALYTLVKRRA